MGNKKPIYLECSCGTEILRVQYDSEGEYYDIAIFEFNSYRGWKYRLKMIWTILRTGSPYGDQMEVSKKEMNRLVDYVNWINSKNDK